MTREEPQITLAADTQINNRRWSNQYIHLISTKPEFIHTFNDRLLSNDEVSIMQNIFTSYSEIYCEIGAGAGSHLASQAERNKSALFIGLELRFKRLFLAAKKCEKLNLKNVKILQLDARQIANLFNASQINGFYINFPDPWADKRRWRKNRLIKPEFIRQMHSLLKRGGFISYKTDHTDNFKETVDLFKGIDGFTLSEITYDLYNSNFIESNISSEFERLFISRGDPICYLFAKKI